MESRRAKRKTPRRCRSESGSGSEAEEGGLGRVWGGVVVSLAQGRGRARGELGLAWMSLERASVTLSQFADSATFGELRTRLAILEPTEILVPDASVERDGNMGTLVELVKEDLPATRVVAVSRRYFHEAKGLEDVRRYCLPDSVLPDLRHKYYCLAAFAALVRYAEFATASTLIPASVKIVYRPSCAHCQLDLDTAKQLELVRKLGSQGSVKGSVYEAVNRTQTPSGARALRATLLQPLSEATEIQARQDVLQAFLEKPSAADALRQLLGKLKDAEGMVAMWSWRPKDPARDPAEVSGGTKGWARRLAQAVRLRDNLHVALQIRHVLEEFPEESFADMRAAFEDSCLQYVLDLLEERLEPEKRLERLGEEGAGGRAVEAGAKALRTVQYHLFAVRAGLDAKMDIARRTYTEMLEDIEDRFQTLRAHSPSLQLRLVYSTARGFHVQIQTKRDASGRLRDNRRWLPSVFTGVTEARYHLSATTEPLLYANDRLKASADQIYQLSCAVVEALLGDIQRFVPALHAVCESLAWLDLRLSMAAYCGEVGCVRPELTPGVLALRQARHPLLLAALGEDLTVPNDAFLFRKRRLAIITGPNMGGKSTYIKMVALLCVLGQGGFFLPADYASLPVLKTIFTRISPEDDMAEGRSNFAQEMSEVAYILRAAGEESLVVIDELCRSTSAEEGLAMLQAIAEEFLQRQPLTLISTHFLDLAQMEAVHPEVLNYHIASSDDPGQRIPHNLQTGPYLGPLYGLELAKLALLPPKVVQDAGQLAEAIRSANRAASTEDPVLLAKRRAANSVRALTRHSHLDLDFIAPLLIPIAQNLRRTLDSLRQEGFRVDDDGPDEDWEQELQRDDDDDSQLHEVSSTVPDDRSEREDSQPTASQAKAPSSSGAADASQVEVFARPKAPRKLKPKTSSSSGRVDSSRPSSSSGGLASAASSLPPSDEGPVWVGGLVESTPTPEESGAERLISSTTDEDQRPQPRPADQAAEEPEEGHQAQPERENEEEAGDQPKTRVVNID